MKIGPSLAAVVLAVSTCFAQQTITIPPPAPTNLRVLTNGLTSATNFIPVMRLPLSGAGGLVDWNPGVPGGIPNYPNCVNVMNYGAHADGSNDDSAAFSSAISACTNGGAVYVPTGMYRLNSTIYFKSGKSFVMRGDGPNKTVILRYGP